jgi:hypothetical protein
MNEYFDKHGNKITLEEHLEQVLPAMLDLIATWMIEWMPEETGPNPQNVISQFVNETSHKDYFGKLLNSSDELAHK